MQKVYSLLFQYSHAKTITRRLPLAHSQELDTLETKQQLVQVLSDSGFKKEHTYAEICRPKRPATPPTPVYDNPLMEKSPLVHCQPLMSSRQDAVPMAQEYLDFVPSAASTLTGHAEMLASKLQAIIGPPGVADPESRLESEGNRETTASQLPNGGSNRIDIYNLELGEQKNHNIANGKAEKEEKDAYQLLEDAQIPGLEPKKRPPSAPGADGSRTEDRDTIDEPLAIDAGPIPGPRLPTAAATNAVTQKVHTPNDVSYETPPDCTEGSGGPVYHTLDGKKAPVYHTLEGGKAPVYHTLEEGKAPVYHTLEGGKAPVYHTLEEGGAPVKARIHPNHGDPCDAKTQPTTGTAHKRAVRHAYTPIDTTQQAEDNEYTVPIKSSPERYLSERGHMYHVIGLGTPQNS